MIKKKKEILLEFPPKASVDSWMVVGLDPSLSSTGYALMEVRPEVLAPHGFTGRTNAVWFGAGSIRPETSADPIWVRSKMIGMKVRKMIEDITVTPGERVGLLLSLEFPTPMDDYLVSLNRILHLILFETDSLLAKFAEVRVLMTNAATLRSLMGLFKKGNNKGENIAKAYEFIDKVEFPQLDSDACDAVLLGMVGRHTASILLGRYDAIPDNFKTSLCNAEKGTKGAGRNIKVITKGILHRPEYFYDYTRKTYAIKIRDAKSLEKRLNREEFQV